MMSFLEPSMEEQQVVLDAVTQLAVARIESASHVDVSPRLDAAELRLRLGELDPELPMDARAAIEWSTNFMDESMVHTTSPSYFGLFNPSPSFMGVVGDILTAVYNPQLAVWSHAPGPVEIEAWLIQYLGHRIGFADDFGGSFTSGGAEANAMAVHLALTHTFPDFGSKG
jgi:aromatic-L-amino-acid decarboxylase